MNLMKKKYIRAKAFLLNGFVYALICQLVFTILHFIAGEKILSFFVPTSRPTEREYFLSHCAEYIKRQGQLALLGIPVQYAIAIFQIEDNFILELMLNSVHLLVGSAAYIAIQATIGDEADLYYPEYYANIFIGGCSSVFLFRKLFEVI